MLVATALSQALLYAPSAFYGYPWKPMYNSWAGDNYVTAFQHFATQHGSPLNLALHVVALTVQVLGNAATLAHIDKTLFPAAAPLRPLSALNAWIWSISIIATGAPI